MNFLKTPHPDTTQYTEEYEISDAELFDNGVWNSELSDTGTSGSENQEPLHEPLAFAWDLLYEDYTSGLPEQEDFLAQHPETTDFINVHRLTAEQTLTAISNPLANINSLLDQYANAPNAFAWAEAASPHTIPKESAVSKPLFKCRNFLMLLSNCAVKKGYELDYIYASTRTFGEPLVYARLKDAPPLTTKEAFVQYYSLPALDEVLGQLPSFELCFPFLVHMHPPRNPQGIFELALLALYLRRFYLFGKSRHNAQNLLCSPADVAFFCHNTIGGLTPAAYEKLKTLDPLPKIFTLNGFTMVRFLSYERKTGYLWLHCYFNKNILLHITVKKLSKTKK